MKATNEVISTDNPVAVTFDTLSAAQELREAGLDNRQAEAIVTTINKAMSETVATKADLELQAVTTRADIDLLRTEVKGGMKALRTEVKGAMEALRTEMKAEIATLQDKIVIKLGALMVTMTFLLLALGPFYFRWVMSLMGTG